MNVYIRKFLFLRKLLIVSIALTIVGCNKEIKNDIIPTKDGTKLVFTVKGMNTEIPELNSKLAGIPKLENSPVENKDVNVSMLSNRVNLTSQSLGKSRDSNFISSNTINDKKISKLAATIPVGHDVRYRLLLFDNENDNLVANVEAKVNQELSINVTPGHSYYWRAYTHNSKEALEPLDIANNGFNIETSIDKDLLWAASSTPITATTLTDSLGIIFDYKVGEFVINLDINDLYGNISDLSMEFASETYFKKGSLNLKNGTTSNFTTVTRRELSLSDFKAIPDSKILQAKYYTVDPTSITDFSINIKKLTVNQDDNSLMELHKTGDPIKNVNFLFNPAITKSHVARMAFRYKIPSKLILHVTATDSDDDHKMALAAQPYARVLSPGWSSAPADNRPPFNMIKAPRNYGLLSNSIVHTEGFTHKRCLEDFKLNEMLNVPGEIPDIVIISVHYALDADDISELITYLNEGGTVIMFTAHNGDNIDREGVVQFMNTLFNKTDITIINNIYPSGSLFEIDHNRSINDRIVNGPFGNISGKFWGVDYYDAIQLKNIPSSQVTAYSNPSAVNSSRISEDLSMFKHNYLNLFWIGNGGFLSGPEWNKIGGWNTETEKEPFATVYLDDVNNIRENPNPDYNYNFYPMPKFYGRNYNSPIFGNVGHGNGYMNYNAPLFANLMAWALYQSEFFGVNPRIP